MPQAHKIGNVSIQKIEEQELREVAPEWMFPAYADQDFQAIRPRLAEIDMEAGAPQLRLSIHSWLVRTPDHLVLIDTGSGNGKGRPRNPAFHQQNTPFLERLAAAGVKPEDIDYVINTHLHVDHSGWNTMLVDGKWVPTFPNARYLFPRREVAYWSSAQSHHDDVAHSEFVFEDSVQPIIEAGLVDYIEPTGDTLLDIFEFVETPGHCIGHMSVKIRSGGEEGVVAGDLMHHATQAHLPEWNSVFCEFGDEAIVSRRRMLNYCADTGAMYFSMHFPGTSCGFVGRDGDGFTWTYA